eukprot:scaffold1154_cov132-Amphora_coffeaeformis.AAC.5
MKPSSGGGSLYDTKTTICDTHQSIDYYYNNTDDNNNNKKKKKNSKLCSYFLPSFLFSPPNKLSRDDGGRGDWERKKKICFFLSLCESGGCWAKVRTKMVRDVRLIN